MIKRNTAWLTGCLLAVGTLVGCGTIPADEVPASFVVNLKVEPSTTAGIKGLQATVTIKNVSDATIPLNPYALCVQCAPNSSSYNLFVVRDAKGDRVTYKGARAIAAPTPADMVQLPAGETYSFVVDLNASYAFSAAEQTYTVQYVGQHEQPKGSAWVDFELKSNAVFATFTPLVTPTM